jgi:UDP-N-acetylglucosamine diphosphorylase / glucose-1-phosphate thymidylyltransferase / UDP-N-acetylgalactosamine diphosphorylase / glucosamine-1-phosphate N-acetyltransferase / galactosamine-1-phosphate N-acetyltransferase
MIRISDFIQLFPGLFPEITADLPWMIPSKISGILSEKIKNLNDSYRIEGNIAIHKTAVLEENITLKGPIIISANCFIAANCYLRQGVYLGENVTVGPGCEIKSSLVFPDSALAHFNFVGDSLLGSNVNLEAGAVIANHFNENVSKEIVVLVGGKDVNTGIEKFGALIGDKTRIGANAVLSPGTLLGKDTIVNRLQLINQRDIGN